LKILHLEPRLDEGNKSRMVVDDHDLYSSPNVIQVIKSKTTTWVGHGARLGDGGVACKIVVGGPEGKRPLGIPRRRWEDKVTIDLREVG
jgi:hypothetical protein